MERIVIIILIILSNNIYGQNIITGKILNSDSIPVSLATVNIIHQNDSIFYHHSKTDSLGSFKINAPKEAGGYLMIVTYPNHTDLSIPFVINSEFKGLNFGLLKILPNNFSIGIEEVLVVGKRALLKQNGDTLEYTLDRLKLDPNAKIEDALKQLPGFQITKGGQIYSFGRVIQQVLVDGEPFFGDDPTLVTKNLRADMVDKIHVYEDVSQSEKITGIQDNNKRDIINIKLKESKKVGVFGNAEGGYFNKVYNNLITLNVFNGQEKFFIYGLLNNTGKIGLGYKNLSSNIGSIGDSFDNSTGNYTGKGIPKTYGGGVNYRNIWNETHKFSTSFNAGGLSTSGDDETLRLLPSTGYDLLYNNNVKFKNNTDNQNLNLKYEYEGVSKFYFDLNAENNQTENTALTATKITNVETDSSLTNLLQNKFTVSKSYSLNFNSNWSRKFNDDKTVLSIGFSPTVAQDKNSSGTDVFNKNEDDSFRMKTIHKSSNLNSNLNLSRSLGSDAIILGYTNRYYESTSNIKTFSGISQNIDSMYSGIYDFNRLSHEININYNVARSKIKADFGTNFLYERNNIDDLLMHNKFSNSFFFIQPRLNFRYDIRKDYSLRINYSNNNSSPSVYLLQPIRTKENLPYIFQGNKNLKPENRNNVNFTLYNFKIDKMRLFRTTLNMSLRKNSIGYNTLISDSVLIYNPINIDHNTSSGNLSSTFSIEVNKHKDYFRFEINGGYTTNYSMINDAENKLNYIFYKATSSYSFFKRNSLQFYFEGNPIYEIMNYSNNSELNYKGLGFDGRSEISYFFPYRFTLIQNMNYTFKPSYKNLDFTLNRYLWDISLRKHFGKTAQYMVEFHINDLLNNNNGYNRQQSSIGLTENRYTTIKRYYLLSFKWELNKMGESR